MSTPLHTVKTEFGSKEALVEKLIPLLDRQADESDAEFKDRLLRVSNRKLLRLWQREQDLRGRFSDRDGLIDAIVKLADKGDAGRHKLVAMSTGRLLSMHWGLERATKRKG